MKKRTLLFALLLITVVLTLVCCNRLPDATLAVRSPYDKQTLTIDINEASNHDFTRYFSLTGDDGTRYPVLDKYLDVSHFSETEGGYVLCTYKDATVRLNVIVTQVSYELTLDVSFVAVHTPEAETYDYLSHFFATIDGEVTAITKSMVESTVQAAAGSYYFRVNFHGVTKTLNVYVEDDIDISTSAKSIQLDDSQIYTYDFTSLFTIKVNGVKTPVTMDDVDISAIRDGTSGTVYCFKGSERASVNVVVVRNMYRIDLPIDTVTLHTSQVDGYDFLSLFTATKNGEPFTLSANMVSSNVKNVAGNYEYTVTIFAVSKTLKVNVTDVHQVETVVNYPQYKLQIGKINTFDYTTLFSLYVDGKAREVLPSMVDRSAVTNDVKVGDVCEITFAYDNDGVTVTDKTEITIVENAVIHIESKDVVAYPNSKPIDFTTLFTVYEGDTQIPVTMSMISVPANYPIIGDNVITLSYGGEEATATITVKRGVIINTAADDIYILKGTNKQNYFFQDDIEVIVNGIVIDNVLSYIDVSNVDFNVVGVYPVKISVPYNDKNITGVSGSANLTYVEETVLYHVVNNTYTLSVKQDLVQINVGDNFNVGSNINLVINGRTQGITTNPDNVNILTCYAKIIQNVDTSVYGLQHVVIDLYINGVDDPSPVRVEYDVEVLSDADITINNKVVFTGSTLYTKDLFTITRNGANVPVTQDMVSGHVNTFKTGEYFVELAFEGITRVARVVVLDNALVGSYTTPMHTVAVEAEYDEDDLITVDPVPAVQYGPMVINSDGSITVNGKAAEIVSVLSERELIIKIGDNNYTAYIDNGIITLIPDNSLMLKYNNNKRPLAYFIDNVWAINRNNNHFVINSGRSYNHIMESESVKNYTVEVLRAYNKTDFTNITYAIKILLAHRSGAMSGDVMYNVTFGEAQLNDGFNQAVFEKGELTFNGEKFKFTFSTDATIARTDNDEQSNPYAGMTFTNGKATLAIDANGGITYTPVGAAAISVSAMTTSQTRNVKYDFENNTVLAYELDAPITPNQNWFSYKFVLDPSNMTFTVADKDKLYGLYFDDTNKYYIFLDGYGGGHVSTNFAAYTVTELTYTVLGNEAEIAFEQVLPNFVFGERITFYIADMYNVLTCKSAQDDSLVEMVFENRHISYGAVIRFDSQVFRASVNANKDSLYNLISVTTANGELSLQDKISNNTVDLRAVDIKQSGIYQIRVRLLIGEETFTAYYAIQVITPLSPAPAFAGNYGSGATNGDYKLITDEFGLATITVGGVEVAGNVEYLSDGFAVIGRFNGGAYTLTATVVGNGVICVESHGAIHFTDYFSKGTAVSANDGSSILTKLTVDSVDTYVWKASAIAQAEIVTVTFSDNTLCLATASGDVYVRVSAWNGNGCLTVFDGLRGEYTNAGNTLSLDGFGTAVFNGHDGTYVINANNSVTVTAAQTVKVAYVNLEQGTFTLSQIVLDETLVEGKMFECSYIFVCGKAPCSTVTAIKFGADGRAEVTSTSEHDDICSEHHKYEPKFVSDKATYSVSGNRITVKTNNYTVTFEIADVTSVTSLRTLSTTVGENDMGYFSVGAEFVLK